MGIFKIRFAASAFRNCSDKRTISLSSSISGVLLVNGELRVADDVEEENVRDLQLDLLFYLRGHISAQMGAGEPYDSDSTADVESKG